MHPYNNEENDTLFLVNQYEAMLKRNAVGFFEQSSFERLLDYYEENHKLDLAIEVTDYALEQHPYSVQFFIRKAQLFLDKNLPDQALDCLAQAEVLNAFELDIHLLRSEALSWQGKYKKALECLNYAKTIIDASDHDEICLGIANVYEDMELFDKSFEALGDALKINPKNKVALDRMWLLVELSGKYQDSVDLHMGLIDQDPYSHQAWYNLGHAYFCLVQYEEAVEAFEYAIVINEEFEFAYRDCAEALFRLGLFERAIKCYTDALEYVKPDSDLYSNLGLCYEQLNQFAKAKRHYFKAIKMDPQNDHAFYLLGECYGKENHWVSAINAFKKAIKLNNQNADYIAALADAYVQVEEYEKAAELFRTATEMAPEESEKWVQFASFLLIVNLPELALEVIEEALIYCDSPALDYCQTATLLCIGYRKAATESLHNALSNDFELHAILFELYPNLKNDSEMLAILAQYGEVKPKG